MGSDWDYPFRFPWRTATTTAMTAMPMAHHQLAKNSIIRLTSAREDRTWSVSDTLSRWTVLPQRVGRPEVRLAGISFEGSLSQ